VTRYVDFPSLCKKAIDPEIWSRLSTSNLKELLIKLQSTRKLKRLVSCILSTELIAVISICLRHHHILVPFQQLPKPTQSWQLSTMAPTKTNNSSSSNNRNGEALVRRANVLASCYVVDSSALLKGFHYSTTGADGSYLSDPSSLPT
jgi:hypothetical protein